MKSEIFRLVEIMKNNKVKKFEVKKRGKFERE